MAKDTGSKGMSKYPAGKLNQHKALYGCGITEAEHSEKGWWL